MAWRAHYSAHVGDTEDLLTSVRKLQELRENLDEIGTYDKTALSAAKDFIRSIPRLEQELLHKREDSGGEEREPMP